jgi:NarL family two-component system sensor histidine kinase YdfH
MDKKSTAILAGISVIAIILSHVVNPYYTFILDSRSLTNLSIYFTAVCLAAILPFVVNANLRQHLEHEHIQKERRRLSREIHDGVAQTLLALSWQAQQVRARLIQTNSDGDDIQQMEKLADKARHDIVESLEILRNYESQGNFITLIREQLQNLKQDSKINFTLELPNIDLRLDGKVELEIMHVFQEALMNIKKHSGARSVYVKLKWLDGKLGLNIIDDGQGFDSLAYYQNISKVKGHYGLTVMQERLNSINGQLKITSTPGKGTNINIEVPCKIAEVEYGS